MRAHDVEWDALEGQRPDALLARRQELDELERQRVGWEPDWKLRVVMLREEREQRASDVASERERQKMLANPDYRDRLVRLTRANWANGAYANRPVRYAKRTDKRVATAREMRAEGYTLAQIGVALDVTASTVNKWLGWQRKPEPTNRCPVVLDGVTYESQRAAARATGRDRGYIRRNGVTP